MESSVGPRQSSDKYKGLPRSLAPSLINTFTNTMAEITAAVNGLVALCLRSTRTRAAQPDTRHLGSALEKVESAESSDSEFTEKHKRLPQQQQQQQQRWKRLRWTGWSRKEGLVVVVKADS